MARAQSGINGRYTFVAWDHVSKSQTGNHFIVNCEKWRISLIEWLWYLYFIYTKWLWITQNSSLCHFTKLSVYPYPDTIWKIMQRPLYHTHYNVVHYHLRPKYSYEKHRLLRNGVDTTSIIRCFMPSSTQYMRIQTFSYTVESVEGFWCIITCIWGNKPRLKMSHVSMLFSNNVCIHVKTRKITW